MISRIMHAIFNAVLPVHQSCFTGPAVAVFFSASIFAFTALAVLPSVASHVQLHHFSALFIRAFIFEYVKLGNGAFERLTAPSSS